MGFFVSKHTLVSAANPILKDENHLTMMLVQKLLQRRRRRSRRKGHKQQTTTELLLFWDVHHTFLMTRCTVLLLLLRGEMGSVKKRALGSDDLAKGPWRDFMPQQQGKYAWSHKESLPKEFFPKLTNAQESIAWMSCDSPRV
jgi:hypothetical protein